MTGDPSDQPEVVQSSTRAIFLAWEKLRLVFNAVLTALVLLQMVQTSGRDLQNAAFWLLLIQCALIANVCYFAGPALESYLAWLGVRHAAVRPAVFLAGTLFAILLAIVVLFSFAMRDFD